MDVIRVFRPDGGSAWSMGMERKQEPNTKWGVSRPGWGFGERLAAVVYRKIALSDKLLDSAAIGYGDKAGYLIVL
jgi:hypothetical protein